MAALNSLVAGRNNLWKEENLIATGCMTIDDVGLENTNELEYIKLVPNPAQTTVYLELNDIEADQLELWIRNPLGQLVHEEKIETANSVVKLDVSNLPEGLYWVEISNGKTSATKKLIIE
ncbi:MAG: T9SS type A sorting domain-containing protein [Flavobacteriales bacterium]|nr:T9SS type A sorting domain-containing protein [Flavobacteriales bacterium]